jgi:hypothetical protein
MFGLSRRERWQKLKMRETEVLASLVATAIQARPQIDRARIDELECVVSDLAKQVKERDAEIARLRAENAELRGAMQAADERLLSSGKRVGFVFGCDTPDAMADEIARLRAENAELRAIRADFAHRNAELWERAEKDRADAERYRWLVQWMHQHGLLMEHFCQPSAFEKVANWWMLKEPAMIKGDSCVGYSITPDRAIDAARKDQA